MNQCGKQMILNMCCSLCLWIDYFSIKNIQIYDIYTLPKPIQMDHTVFRMHTFHRWLQSIALKSWIRTAPGQHWKRHSSLIFHPILVRFAALDRLSYSAFVYNNTICQYEVIRKIDPIFKIYLGKFLDLKKKKSLR